MNIVQLLDLAPSLSSVPSSPPAPLPPPSTSFSSSSSSSTENHRTNTAKTARELKFGIASILEPGFGSCRRPVVRPHRVPCPSPSFADLCHASCGFGDSSQHQRQFPNDHCSPPAALPSWIFCTRYSDRPSSGHRTRKTKRRELSEEEKRPRTAFTAEQLERLKAQFVHSRYLTEKKRQELAHELGLNECQIKIWFQNKRAKLKKSAQRVQQSTMRSLMGPGMYKPK